VPEPRTGSLPSMTKIQMQAISEIIAAI
jgi:hypothetical protein